VPVVREAISDAAGRLAATLLRVQMQGDVLVRPPPLGRARGRRRHLGPSPTSGRTILLQRARFSQGQPRPCRYVRPIPQHLGPVSPRADSRFTSQKNLERLMAQAISMRRRG
jgi:hypothetical protein